MSRSPACRIRTARWKPRISHLATTASGAEVQACDESNEIAGGVCTVRRNRGNRGAGAATANDALARRDRQARRSYRAGEIADGRGAQAQPCRQGAGGRVVKASMADIKEGLFI